MKKNKLRISILTVKTLFILLCFAAAAQAQRGDLTADELRRASPTVQARLQKTRQLIGSRKLAYSVGLTTVSELPLNKATGELPPADLKTLAAKQNALVAKQLNVSVAQLPNLDFSKIDLSKLIFAAPKLPVFEIDQYGDVIDKSKKPSGGGGTPEKPKAPPKTYPKCVAGNAAWDARTSYFVVPPVRNQGGCGSCWVFASQGAFELSPLTYVKGPITSGNSSAKDTSEQYTLDMSNGGDCDGGYTHKALDFLIASGSTAESKIPYKAVKGSPDSQKGFGDESRVKKISLYGYVNPDAQIPSVAEIKNAICQHRSVISSMYASDEFQDYTGGVFGHYPANYNAQVVYVGFQTNHAVLIIGWGDAKEAWLVKNSWGSGWGETGGTGKERGYAWVRYGNAGIGAAAKWVQ